MNTDHTASSGYLASGSRPLERGISVSLASLGPRLALGAIILLAAVLDFVGLSREGYSNEYYAAAIRSMSQSWHNFFFNSFDPGGFVTIDKPPLGFWFQVASVKLFGFSGVALLIPQALAGVLSVALLYHLIARTFGRAAGLTAALALAITPISVVTNRNNTIDSTLVLFVLLGAWAVLRAAETGRLRWLLLCAVFVGLGFNIKMLQAFLVLPAFALVYLLGARIGVRRRLLHLVLAAGALLVVSFSWVTAVDLTPAADRPWVDSTTTNSELDLAIGYNGLQRLTGNHSIAAPSAGSRANGGFGGPDASGGVTVGPGGAGPGGNGGPGGIGENGPTGVLRLLDTQLASQIGWLLPLAVIGFLLATWQSRPRFRALDHRQRSILLWGMWLLTTGAFFSIALFFHTYYLVMVAPAISALAGIGVAALWTSYRQPGSRMWWVLPLALLLVAAVQVHVLASYPSWSRWLAPIAIAGCVLAALATMALRFRRASGLRAAAAATVVGVGALLAAPAAFAAETAQNTQTGAILRAGPTAAGMAGGFGGAPGAAAFSPARLGPLSESSTSRSTGAAPFPASPSAGANGSEGKSGSSSTVPGTTGSPPCTGSASGFPSGKPPVGGAMSAPPPGAPPAGTSPGAGSPSGAIGPPTGSGSQRHASGQRPSACAPSSASGRLGSAKGGASRGSTSGGSAVFGALPNGSSGSGQGGPGEVRANSALTRYLVTHRGSARYLVATTSSNEAAPIIIATGDPVMSLGGFSGSDPILTTAELKKLIEQGTVRYFLLGGMGGGPNGNGITSWVESNCSSVTYTPSASTSTSSRGGGPGGFGGPLYRCGSGR